MKKITLLMFTIITGIVVNAQNWNTTTGISTPYVGWNAWSAGNSAGTQGLYHVFIGDWSGTSVNSNSTSNTFVGINSGFSTTSGSYNCYFGEAAGFYGNTSSNNTLIGYNAGYSNTADDNTYIGYGSGFYFTSSTGNTFIGSHSGFGSNSTSDIAVNNTFVGNYTGYSITTGFENVFTGSSAGYLTSEGSDNTFTGEESGYSNTVGSENTFEGFQAGYYNTDGVQNTAIGMYANYNTTSSTGNTSLGVSAGSSVNNGNYNTFIGYNAAANAASITNSSALGYNSSITASNQVRIGNTSVTSIGGQVGWTTLSDGRVKKNVQSNVPGLDFIKKLRPVTYNLDVDAINNLLHSDTTKLLKHQKPFVPTQEEIDAKANRGKIIYSGFIAQEVEKAAQEAGYNFSGVDAPKNDKDVYGLRYAEFTVPLIKAVQEIADENILLKKGNDSLVNVINNFNARLSAIENLNKGTGSNTLTNPSDTKQAYLEQNSPNPFTDNTIIKYYIPENSISSKIVITSDKGLEVMNIVIDNKGFGSIIVSGNTLTIGSYTCQLIIDGKQVDMKKMLLIK